MMALQYSCRGCSDLCCQIRNKLFCHFAKVCMGMPSSFAVRLTLSSFSLTLAMASALKLSLYSTLFLVMVNSCLGCQFTKYFLPFFSAYITKLDIIKTSFQAIINLQNKLLTGKLFNDIILINTLVKVKMIIK